MFTIAESFLLNTAKPSQPRHGTWRMIVTRPVVIIKAADPGAAADGEHYSYDVLTDSALRLDVTLDQAAYFAGDPIVVTAKLTAHGVPVTGASALLTVTAPGTSMDNFLAGVPVSAEEFRHAADLLSGKDANGVFIKAFAAELKGIVFPGATVSEGIPMTDPDQRGIYTATVNQTSIPDGHTLYVTVTGTTADGVTFRRERKVEALVRVRPDRLSTLFNISYAGGQTNPQAITGLVSVTPRDRFGNVILIDPATSQHIQLTAQGATLDPKLATTFNGTYTSQVVYPAGSNPTISLVVGGQPVVTDEAITPGDQFIWVDRVLGFEAGIEAAPGANQHANPDNVLGNLLTKPTDTFVALGGYGAIAVGVRGQIILAQGADDITVFVHSDNGDLRPYVVEARTGDDGKDDDDHFKLLFKHHHHHHHHDDDDDDKDDGGWVVLGRSSGATASFSLLDVRLSSTSAIRITDESGQTRNGELKPLAAPGACLRAVGVRSTAPKGSDAGICIQIRVLNPQGGRLGGRVDLTFEPQEGGETREMKDADASKDINVSDLQRTPQGIYAVTVTPTDVFTPTAQFVTIPASGFERVDVIVDKTAHH
jgi:hypothetical protein